MAKLASKIYADALFSLALEEEKVDSMWKEVGALRDILDANPDFLKVCEHPAMTVREKEELVDKTFGEDFSKEIMGFLHVLLKKGRFNEIEKILELFDAKAKEHEKIGVVYVYTPTELTDEQKEETKKRLLETSGFETLEMNYCIDETLLGGIKIRIGDRVLDNTIRTKLDGMSAKLSKIRV